MTWNLQQLRLKPAIQRRGINVRSRPVEIPAATRARWLAEVAETLEQAESLVDRLKRNGQRGAEMAEVAMRLEAAKRAVAALRTSRQSRPQTDPQWTKLPPWENGDSTV
jgi:hypothetical protein